MNKWPNDLSLDAFKETWSLEGPDFWLSVFEAHKEQMQVKNPAVATGNIEKILNATFKLTYEKGFQGMSLRDLSQETGVSMGGLYAYIGSKSDLASVIEGVLRTTIEQVLGSLSSQQLEPLARLKAIIYGELYMMEQLKPWYYFCFMELKGLTREQQQQTLDVELRFESFLLDAIQQGCDQGIFNCEQKELLAAQVTAQLQQWHLKQWKFKVRRVSLDEYARYVFNSLVTCLHYDRGGLEAVEISAGKSPDSAAV